MEPMSIQRQLLLTYSWWQGVAFRAEGHAIRAARQQDARALRCWANTHWHAHDAMEEISDQIRALEEVTP